MTAAGPSREPVGGGGHDAGPVRDVAELRARRRQALRRRRLARLDVGLGVAAAIVLLLATPGLAITALIALGLLLLCLATIVFERRTRRRATRPRRRRSARPVDGEESALP
jgi:hypothetical protein